MVKYWLVYCLLAPSGHGYQECWQVPATPTMHLHACYRSVKEREEEFRPYRLTCWRADSETY